MKNLFALVALLFASSLFAQNGTIKGTILDSEMNNEPLMFATISLKDTKTSEQTNLFGNFEMHDIESGDYILEISFAGYATKKIPVAIVPNKTIEIQETLVASSFDFDEVTIESKSNTTNASK